LIVVDTSAMIDALLGRGDNARLRDRIASDGDVHAPHLIDVEFIHALRRLVAGRAISIERADACREDFALTAIRRYPHVDLRERIWELRSNFSAYDAAFVSLAEALDAPLVTVDARLARSAARFVAVERF
jgi:predicted nucleic acid-binding protein